MVVQKCKAKTVPAKTGLLHSLSLSQYLQVLFCLASVLIFVILKASKVFFRQEVIYGKPANWWRNIDQVTEYPFEMKGDLDSGHPLFVDMGSFAEKVLKRSYDKYILVVFYDPFSPDYKALGQHYIDVGTQLLTNSLPLQDKFLCNYSRIAMVNVITNNFLSFLHTPEQQSLWLGYKDTSGYALSFRFGRPNDLYPMTTRLFYKGKPLNSTYPWRVSKQGIIRFLREEVLLDTEHHENKTEEIVGEPANSLPSAVCKDQDSKDIMMKQVTKLSAYDFLRENRDVALLLIDQVDEVIFDRAEEVIGQLAASFTKTNLTFAWMNGATFASDFGLNESNLPNMIYYSSEKSGYSVFDLSIQLPFSQDSRLEKERDEMVKWLTRSLNGIELSEKNLNDIRIIQRPKSYFQTSSNSGKKNNYYRPEVWHKRPRDSDVFKSWDFDSLWMEARMLLFNYLRMEEIYQSFSPEQKLKEKTFSRVVKQVHKYLSKVQMKNFDTFSNSVPATPEILKTLLCSVERLNLFRQIERLDTLTMLEKNKRIVENDMTTQNELAELASILENGISYLYQKRGEELQQENKRVSLEQQLILKIDRIHAKDLSLEKFLNEYASNGKPVIIQGLRPFKNPLTLDRLLETCNSAKVELRTKSSESESWAGLRKVEDEFTMEEYIRLLKAGDKKVRQYYLHDFSIPLYCPALLGETFEEYTIPKYFVGDYYQRLPFSNGQHTWPSVFVGAKGTESKLHIDTGGTNFWLYLESGRKEWRVFDRMDYHNLYLKSDKFYFGVDVFNPDLEEYPLFVKSKMYKFTQMPGELVFIPANFPHAVYNHEDIVGFSMNYVDVSNEHIHLWEQLVRGNFRIFEQLVNKDFPRGLSKDEKDMTFSEFKSQNWYNKTRDIKACLTK